VGRNRSRGRRTGGGRPKSAKPVTNKRCMSFQATKQVMNDADIIDGSDTMWEYEFGFRCLARAVVIVSLYMDGVQGNYNNSSPDYNKLYEIKRMR
jgi:hypothetical protein